MATAGRDTMTGRHTVTGQHPGAVPHARAGQPAQAGPGLIVGQQLRSWRERRRVSQLDLSLQAGISARHLSFVETGRSRPSSGLILRLAEELDVPLRDRNALLLAGGFAPAYPEHGLGAPSLGAVTEAMRQVITAHMPNPALAVDGHWELIDANGALAALIEGAAADLLEPPVNVLRLSLHPEGIAPRIVNLGQWRQHVLTSRRCSRRKPFPEPPRRARRPRWAPSARRRCCPPGRAPPRLAAHQALHRAARSAELRSRTGPPAALS